MMINTIFYGRKESLKDKKKQRMSIGGGEHKDRTNKPNLKNT